MNYNYGDNKSPDVERHLRRKNVHIDEFQAARDALLSYDEIPHADLSFPVSGLGE